ncbi:hypothetical protein WMF47_01680 [Sorangium sp. So ce861]
MRASISAARAILKNAATIGAGFPLPLILLTALPLRVRLRALLLAELDALLLAALLLAELDALLLAALLLAELCALLLAALLLAELCALLLAALLLAELRALLLAALLLDALLAELCALLLAALLLRLLLRALLLDALLPVLAALLLDALLPVLAALLLAALLLLLQQRAEELLGLSQVLLDVRSHRLHVSAQPRVVRARDERHVEELEGAAMEGDLRPDVGDVELGAFLVFQRLAQLGRAGLELLAARAGLDVGPAALRQLRPALPRLRVLLDDLLGVALHLRGLGLVSSDLRQLDLLLVDERDQHRDLRLRSVLHRALPAGLPAVALPVAPTADLAAASLPAALIAGLLAALGRAARALAAGLPAAALPALLAGLFAAALPALLAGLPAASLPAAGVLAAALPAAAPATASRAVSACLAAAPVLVRGAPAGLLVAGRPLAARLGVLVAADAAASPREDKAPREHDRHEAT